MPGAKEQKRGGFTLRLQYWPPAEKEEVPAVEEAPEEAAEDVAGDAVKAAE